MGAARKLVCKELRANDSYQSVLNVQKRPGAPYCVVKNEHIQQLHDDSGHWLLTFCSNIRIQICDCLKTPLSLVNRKICLWTLQELYKGIRRQYFAFPETNWWVQSWSLGISLRNWNFRWKITNGRTFWCQMNARALDQLFGKQSSHTIPESLISFKYIGSSHGEVFHKTGFAPQAVLHLWSKVFKNIYEGVHLTKSETSYLSNLIKK